jgi:hypothetical protein
MQKWIRTAFLAIVTVLLAHPTAWAQGSLVTPSVTSFTPKASSMRLMLTAGETGAPYGFEIQWMRSSDYEAMGGWPVEGTPALYIALFSGYPTFNTAGTSRFYSLGAGQTIEVEPGQFFDETGVSTNYLAELDAGTTYILRVRARGDGGVVAPSEFRTYTLTTTKGYGNCTYTIGYWKNHPEAWPVSALTLGTVTYTKAQLLQILETPARGNGILILSHQLIAAKLNIANGADPTLIAATIASADATIGSLVIPPFGTGWMHPSFVNSTANKLDDYNNGILGPGHCGTVPANTATWGSVKNLYRR